MKLPVELWKEGREFTNSKIEIDLQVEETKVV